MVEKMTKAKFNMNYMIFLPSFAAILVGLLNHPFVSMVLLVIILLGIILFCKQTADADLVNSTNEDELFKQSPPQRDE